MYRKQGIIGPLAVSLRVIGRDQVLGEYIEGSYSQKVCALASTSILSRAWGFRRVSGG